MANDLYPLVYEGILDNAAGRPVAGFSRADGMVWLFNLVALEARVANRKAQRLPVAEEEHGLADLRLALST